MQPPFSPHGPLGASNYSVNNPPVSGVNSFNNGGPGGGGGSGGGPGGGGQARLSPHGNRPPFNSSQVSPRVGQPPQQGFTHAQLSPQSAVGARASPGINLVNNMQGQPSPGGWSNNLPNRPTMQTQPPQGQMQQQQQQHMNFGPNPRGYTPAARPSMRSLPSPGPPNPGAVVARQTSFTGMPDGSGPNLGATPPTSTGGMFVHQQQQQQQQRLQRTVSAPSGVIPGKDTRPILARQHFVAVKSRCPRSRGLASSSWNTVQGIFSWVHVL